MGCTSLKPLALLMAAAVLACGGPQLTPGYVQMAGEKPERRYKIEQSIAYTNHQQWWNSPWSRIIDDAMIYPVFVLVDTRGLGCVVPNDIWAINPQYLIDCPSGWLIPRARE